MKTLRALAAALAMSLPLQALADPDDPYIWLEDIAGDKVMSWVKDQNAQSQPRIEGDPRFKGMLERFTAIATSRERIPAISKMGDRVYNFWQDSANPRGIWRRTTLEDYRKASPAWEVVLDLDKLAAAENEKWAWKGATCLYPTYQRCLVSISRGGSDATEIREFDLVKKTFVEGGFRLPESKGSAVWIDENTVYAARDFGKGTMTLSGYPRQIKRVKRGEALDKAPVVFEVAENDLGALPVVVHEKGGRVEAAQRVISTRRAEQSIWRDGKWVKLDVKDSTDSQVAAGTLYLRLREAWKPAGTEYKAGTLLAISLDKFLAGSRELEVVFTPGERVFLSSYSPMKSVVMLNLLDNVASRLVEVRRGSDGRWAQRDVKAPKLAALSAGAFDRRESNEYLMTASGFTLPTTLYFGKAGSDDFERLKSLPDFFNAKGVTVTQHEATSKDGTRIPYFQVMREGAKLDAANPTILYGYGGFEISMTPSYSGFSGHGWLERGGVWVLANLRGGGEFGPQWNQTARREGRQKTHDDFAAVAEDLIRRKVTSPSKLGILGGSQGGLLVTTTMVQRPELFGAVVSTVPLMDMKRFHKLLAGHSWVGEYGDPDKPEDWAFISKYSPYQNAKKGVKYPAMLITTSTRDDRVHPGHARKMAARLQEFGNNTTYFEYTEGGHGAGTTPAQSAYTWAFIYTFFNQTLMGAAK